MANSMGAKSTIRVSRAAALAFLFRDSWTDEELEAMLDAALDKSLLNARIDDSDPVDDDELRRYSAD